MQKNLNILTNNGVHELNDWLKSENPRKEFNKSLIVQVLDNSFIGNPIPLYRAYITDSVYKLMVIIVYDPISGEIRENDIIKIHQVIMGSKSHDKTKTAVVVKYDTLYQANVDNEVDLTMISNNILYPEKKNLPTNNKNNGKMNILSISSTNSNNNRNNDHSVNNLIINKASDSNFNKPAAPKFINQINVNTQENNEDSIQRQNFEQLSNIENTNNPIGQRSNINTVKIQTINMNTINKNRLINTIDPKLFPARASENIANQFSLASRNNNFNLNLDSDEYLINNNNINFSANVTHYNNNYPYNLKQAQRAQLNKDEFNRNLNNNLLNLDKTSENQKLLRNAQENNNHIQNNFMPNYFSYNNQLNNIVNKSSNLNSIPNSSLANKEQIGFIDLIEEEEIIDLIANDQAEQYFNKDCTLSNKGSEKNLLNSSMKKNNFSSNFICANNKDKNDSYGSNKEISNISFLNQLSSQHYFQNVGNSNFPNFNAIQNTSNHINNNFSNFSNQKNFIGRYSNTFNNSNIDQSNNVMSIRNPISNNNLNNIHNRNTIYPNSNEFTLGSKNKDINQRNLNSQSSHNNRNFSDDESYPNMNNTNNNLQTINPSLNKIKPINDANYKNFNNNITKTQNCFVKTNNNNNIYNNKYSFNNNTYAPKFNTSTNNISPDQFFNNLLIRRDHHKLKNLTSFDKDIFITVRCLYKSEKRSYDGGSKSVFNFNIIDKEGSEMPVTCFDIPCIKYYDLIQEKTLYEIYGGYLKINDKKFTRVNSQLKLYLDDKTIIRKINEDNLNSNFNSNLFNIKKNLLDAYKIPTQKYNFVKIENISKLDINKIIDILCYVLEVKDSKTLSSKKSKKETSLKILKIADDTFFKIELSIWGGYAIKEYVPGQILAIRFVKVGEFKGRNLTVCDSSSIEIDPPFAQAIDLKTALDSYNGDYSELPSYLIEMYGQNTDGKTYINIGDLLKYMDCLSMESITLSDLVVKGTIIELQHSDRNYYTGCPVCKKKILLEENLFCVKCNQNYENFVYYFHLNLIIKDNTGEMGLDILGENAENIIGLKCEEYKNFVEKNPNHEKLIEISDNLELRSFYFTISPRVISIENKKSKRFTCVNFSEIETDPEIRLAYADYIKERKIFNNNLLANQDVINLEEEAAEENEEQKEAKDHSNGVNRKKVILKQTLLRQGEMINDNHENKIENIDESSEFDKQCQKNFDNFIDIYREKYILKAENQHMNINNKNSNNYAITHFNPPQENKRNNKEVENQSDELEIEITTNNEVNEEIEQFYNKNNIK